jgi:sialic acid synthase SpsE
MKKNILSNSENSYTYVIGEAGLNHNGSMEIAKKLIDLAIEAGADAVKFQKRTVSKLAVKSYLDSKDDRFPEFGKTYREIREYLEFNFEQYVELKSYAEEKNIDFICTAFDTDAVDFLEKLELKIYKLASHSLTNIELLNYVAQKSKVTILSTGMAEIDEIDAAVNIFKKYNTPLILLHCVSAYPTPHNECNLNLLNLLSSRYSLPVGYSGHELDYLPSLTAVAMGARIIERHFTLNNEMIGFDHKMSLNPQNFISMIKQIREIELIKGQTQKSISGTEWITRNKYHVSLALKYDLKKGQTLTSEMIAYRNPGTGIPPKNIGLVLGKKAKGDYSCEELISVDMFE